MNALKEEELRVNNGDAAEPDDPNLVRGVLDFPTEVPPEKMLLGDGLVRRGDCFTLVSSAGAGKSVAAVQAGICWGLGRSYFGISPSRPLRVLLLSGEDDEVTIGQCREGLINHAEVITGGSIRREDLEELSESFTTDFSREHVGDDFHRRLRSCLEAREYDIVIINPLLSYLGGDVVKEVSAWFRTRLIPILQEFQVGAFVIHHTNKMAKDSWNSTDDVYSGIGGGEVANNPRCVLTLRPTKNEDLFVLKVGKRQTTGWKDSEGKFTDSYFVTRSGDPCRPAWIPAPHDVAAEMCAAAKAGGARQKCGVQDVLEVLESGEVARPELLRKLQARCDCGESTAKNALNEARDTGKIVEREEKNPNGGRNCVLFRLVGNGPKGQVQTTL